MSDCGFQFLIASYHDRELDDERRRAFERHISGCPACAETLSALRALSAEIAVAGEMEGDPDAIARMHFAVDRIAGSEALNSPVARTAGLLTALAASILIIGGVWLLDLRQAESGSGTSIADQSTQT